MQSAKRITMQSSTAAAVRSTAVFFIKSFFSFPVYSALYMFYHKNYRLSIKISCFLRKNLLFFKPPLVLQSSIRGGRIIKTKRDFPKKVPSVLFTYSTLQVTRTNASHILRGHFYKVPCLFFRCVPFYRGLCRRAMLYPLLQIQSRWD